MANHKEEVLKAINFKLYYESELGTLKIGDKGDAKKLCCFHQETKPSLSVNVRSGVFYCFGCNIEGSVFDFHMKRYGLSFPEAIKELAEFAGVKISYTKKDNYPHQKNIQTKWEDIPLPTKEEIQKIYNFFKGKRGISENVVDDHIKRNCIKFTAHRKKECVAVSYKDMNNIPLTIQYLTTDQENFPQTEENKILEKGSAFSSPCFFSSGEHYFKAKNIVLVEAVINAMTGSQVFSDYSWIALGAASNTKKIQELLKHIPPDVTIFSFFDNDKAGYDATKKTEKIIKDFAPNIRLKSITWKRTDPDHCDINDLLIEALTHNYPQAEKITRMFNNAKISNPGNNSQTDITDEWEIAKEIFPRTSLLCGFFPDDIKKSLDRLAVAQGTVQQGTYNAAIAIFASIIGGAVKFYPKKTWDVPVRVWMMDIRPSGSGKSSAGKALAKVLHKAQEKADKDYQTALEQYEAAKKKDRKTEEKEPEKPKNYFYTNLTIEGLAANVSGHGGCVIIYNELSKFVSMQNEYKKSGSDRESWLEIHDASPARIARKDYTTPLNNLYPSIFGGIPTNIFYKIFKQHDGLYLDDGTLFRFLISFDKDKVIDLDETEWSYQDREAWETPLKRAMIWAENYVAVEDWKPINIKFTDEARKKFLTWRNYINRERKKMPDELKGFIPKLAGYAVTLAGISKLMYFFQNNKRLYPGEHSMEKADIERGILMAEFYMGMTIEAIHSLKTEQSIVSDNSDIDLVANALKSLKNKVEKGVLSTRLIAEKYNQNFKKQEDHITTRKMGVILKKLGFTIPKKRFYVDGKAGQTCIEWNKDVEKYLKNYDAEAMKKRAYHESNVQREKCTDIARHPKPASILAKTPISVQTCKTFEKKNEKNIVTVQDCKECEKYEMIIYDEDEDDCYYTNEKIDGKIARKNCPAKYNIDY
jgi:hypothetical protein